jgi:UDP-N-acetylglucosamine diphosphorylase / glucose-1-phosphate thymidylyltransferase / UDP-N-acetylgalactosamine diphosphorylase / glucosamine-1-phosphate N-acetyltransferase / galactosamine-1-phosphate N-acetyltransferase
MTIVIPMAGRGSRLAGDFAGLPKPLVPVAGEPMVRRALQSLDGVPYDRIVFVLLEEHAEEYGLAAALREWVGPEAEVVLLKEVTQGQLCTVLCARDWIDPAQGILIGNADTFVRSALGAAIAGRSAECRGIISVAALPGDRWSFVRLDDRGRAVEVAEKRRVSEHACTGLYYFSSGAEFLDAADQVIASRERVAGEYYVMPVYQRLIDRGARIEVSVAGEVWDMGTPEALRAFEQHLARTGRAAA